MYEVSAGLCWVPTVRPEPPWPWLLHCQLSLLPPKTASRPGRVCRDSDWISRGWDLLRPSDSLTAGSCRRLCGAQREPFEAWDHLYSSIAQASYRSQGWGPRLGESPAVSQNPLCPSLVWLNNIHVSPGSCLPDSSGVSCLGHQGWVQPG